MIKTQHPKYINITPLPLSFHKTEMHQLQQTAYSDCLTTINKYANILTIEELVDYLRVTCPDATKEIIGRAMKDYIYQPIELPEGANHG